MKDSHYFKACQLMLEALEAISNIRNFALKGGTAINCFFRDLPRLSVDIDLTYLPLESRETTLDNIEFGLKEMGKSIKSKVPGVKIFENRLLATQTLTKLVIQRAGTAIKIEPNLIVRGAVFPTTLLPPSLKIQELFDVKNTKILCLSKADVYAGKLCAAMDRQHPRDIFDMKLLLENEGLSDEIRKAFIVYAASNDGPIHHMLKPSLKPISQAFFDEFQGMTRRPISLENLIEVRKAYMAMIPASLTASEREFLLTLKRGEPKWSLLGIPGIENLSGLKWKLFNIRRMPTEKHRQQLEALKQVLEA